MNTTDILTQAHTTAATTDSGQETVGTCLADDLSPTVESMTLEELDVGGSEFSWSSVGSGPSVPIVNASAVTLGTPGEEVAVAKEIPTLNQRTASTETRTEHSSAPSMQKHSLYFWETITLMVEGVVFQLPKYRFVEESDVFMGMVVGDKADESIELDVDLVDFEGFLKAFLPRASSMYDAKPTLTKKEWISVLKLSTLWLFNDLRKFAISQLHWLITDPIERICLAKEYIVYDWLLEGCEDVVLRLLYFDDPDGESMTLTAQEGQRIGMDVALALSGIAIRRLRLAERKAPLRDVRSDVLDVFKEDLYRVREEGVRFMTRAEREEEARWKVAEEAMKKQKEEAEEQERQRVDRESARNKAAEGELRRQEEEGRSIAQTKEPEMPNSAGVPTPNPGRKLSKKKVNARRVVKQDEAKEPKLEDEGAKPLAAGNATGLEEEARGAGEGLMEQLEDESAKRSEEEEMNKLKEEIAKRLDDEERLRVDRLLKKMKDDKDKKIQALAEEEMKRRMGPAEDEPEVAPDAE
ncbi:hypothetical protein BKA70DRAFT_1579029 [Coprinopsis sp. MPI-PUGE-AT-0042]|nr:hypothetical protein BKA70DRAFT_1579029 [Coprinopsis sp. MPI-PUGE-AT-0042]